MSNNRFTSKITPEVISKLMENQLNIRNISVIAHVDHGKTTLTNCLGAKTDYLDYENDHGITIKSTSVSLVYEKENNDNNNNNYNEFKEESNKKYLINLIDSPGHVDFNSEVTAALRSTDGALVVVDCAEGVCIQTETVLKQAINEEIELILFLNKMDRIFDRSNNEIYNTLKNSINSVNTILQTYDIGDNNDNNNNNNNNIDLLPSNGKVGFGSGKQGWGFNLDIFADMYTNKFGIKKTKMMEKLWGNYYFDNINKKWKKCDNNNNNETHDNAFITFVLRPIVTLMNIIIENYGKGDENEENMNNLLKCLGIYDKMISFYKEDLKQVKRSKDFMQIALKTWLPIDTILFEMICEHLPNPIKAQSHRMDRLYTGPLDSKEAQILRACKPNGPTMVYISKMVPTGDFSRFVAFGRVFSGTIKSGQEITILNGDDSNDSDMINGDTKQLRKIKIQKCYIMMGSKREIANNGIPCGNVCGLEGLDKYVSNSCTLIDSLTLNEYDFLPLKTMNFNVSPIVEIAVNVVNQKDLNKLTEALNKLNKFDNLVEIKRSKRGENIIAGAGELHLITCLDTLSKLFLNKDLCPIVTSEPIVTYNETVIGNINNINNNNNGKEFLCVSKSKNKHNRLYMSCSAIKNNEFLSDLENNSLYYLNNIRNKDGLKSIQQRIIENKYNLYENDTTYNMFNDTNDCLKIWSFGCIPSESSFCNIIIDESKGIQLLKEIKSDIISGFKQITDEGVLCGEQLRGVKFNIHDAKIHSDKAHRGSSQITPMTKRVCYATSIYNKPRLMEAMYKVEIIVKNEHVNGVYATLNKRKGEIINDILKDINSHKIDANIPVANSFGFDAELKGNTQGSAFPTLQFSHWSIMNNDPYIDKNIENIILKIRQRKGMKQELPQFNDYYDKIN